MPTPHGPRPSVRLATLAPRTALRMLPVLVALVLAPGPGAAATSGEWRYAAQPPTTDLNYQTTYMVFDPVRERMLLLGSDGAGGPGTAVWALPTTGADTWTLQRAEGAPSSLSYTVDACYDTERDRLLVWDGGASTLWTVTLGTPLHWTGRAVTGPAPNVRASACTFDAAHSRMLVFGGCEGYTNVVATVWALATDDTATWRVLMPSGTGPTGRMNAVAVVDPAEDRLIMHGGRDFTGPMTPRGDVWALSLSGPPAWTALFTADTSASLRWYGHAAVLDTARRRLLVLGGQISYSVAHDEVAAFALDAPHEYSVAVPPDPSRGAITFVDFAAYDGGHDAVFEYGMRADVLQFATRRLALSPTPTWALVVPPQPRPPQRFGQATAYDPVRDRWLSFGGRYTYYVHYELPTVTYDDLRSFRPDPSPTWEDVPVTGARPPARQYGQMVHDAAGDRMILFGGSITTEIGFPLHRLGTTHFYGDAWALAPAAPAAWSPLAPGGPGPAPRDGHVMVLDTRRHRVLVFGGRDSLGPRNDLWALTLDGVPAWSPLTPGGPAPGPRWNAGGAYDALADRLVVACGYSGTGPLTDAWELRLDVPAPEWAPLPTSGAAPTTGAYARPYAFDAARRRLLLFGTAQTAEDGGAVLLPVWELSLGETPGWTALAPSGPMPWDRYGASAALDPAHDRVALFGGTSGTDASYCQSDHWILDFHGGGIVAVEVSLVSAEASPGRVTLTWWASEPPALARVERREDLDGWRRIGEPVAGGDGLLRFEDVGAVAGRRYSYRLCWSEDGSERSTAETWVSVPAAAALALALEAPAPQPSVGEARVAFTLPASGRATLAVFDLAGRRVEAHDLGGLDAGCHTLTVGGALPPGLYLLRLTQGGAAITRRWCVVR